MHPRDCPPWEYDDHPNRVAVLKDRTTSLLKQLRQSPNSLNAIKDTRPAHRHLFSDLTPKGFEYYAGHYRGEEFRCLKFLNVMIRSDPRVGEPPEHVLGLMAELADRAQREIAAMDKAFQLPNAFLPLTEKVKYVVAFACSFFVDFLRIHPYANGNGHAARFLIWSILGRYKLWPYSWPIEPRPNDPPYTPLIFQHRNGDPEPLETYILSCLIPPAQKS